MEEQQNVSKEVQMHAETPKEKKLSYDDLKNVCADLSQQVQNQKAYIGKLLTQLKQMNMVIELKRLDYLFKVVECANNFSESYSKFNFTSSFIHMCVEEIESTLTPPSENEASKSPKE